jgi:hypothetical protein
MCDHVPRFRFHLCAVAILALAQGAHAAPSAATASVVADAKAEQLHTAARAARIPEPGSPTLLVLLAAGGLALGRRLSRSGGRPSSDN